MRVWVAVLTLFASQVVGASATQNRPDFSGRWILVDSGAGEGRAGGAGSPLSSQVVISGAGVNCASECTIVQTAVTLTVSRPVNAQGVTPPDVVLGLDGPGGSVKATVKWEGPKLIVTRSVALSVITQTLSLNEGRLSVVTTFSAAGMDPATFTYKKAG